MTRKLKTVDKLAALNAEIKVLTTQRDKLTTSLKLKGPGTYEGENHVAIVTESVRTGFDTITARKFLTAAELLKCQKPSRVLSVTVKDVVPIS